LFVSAAISVFLSYFLFLNVFFCENHIKGDLGGVSAGNAAAYFLLVDRALLGKVNTPFFQSSKFTAAFRQNF